MPFAVTPYRHSDAEDWDRLVATSTSGTFLHTRRFLAYHRDRFTDLSACIWEGRSLVGVLPAAAASERESTVASHPGLSYGGFVHAGRLCGPAMLSALRSVLEFYSARNFRVLRYKVVPSIYHRAPAQDDLYAIFRQAGRRYRCDLAVAIDLRFPLEMSVRRKRALKKATKAELVVSDDPGAAKALWAVLTENLAGRHDAKPTHTLKEILYLRDQFPENILFVTARLDGSVVGGIVLFLTSTVLHAQYICSSEVGRSVGALDLLFAKALEMSVARGLRYLSFGVCNEDDGKILNEGLYRFKSEFGGAGVAHEFYEIDV